MKKKAVKAKPNVWFVPKRGSYLPASWQGWTSYLVAIAYLSTVYVYIDSLTDNPQWIAVHMLKDFLFMGLVLTWIAQQRS